MDTQRETASAEDGHAQQGPVVNTGLIGGGLIAIVGVAVTVYAMELRIGSVTSMGPGFFPLALGVTTIIVGLLNMVFGLRDTANLPRVPWRALFSVLASISVFALMIRTTGLGPAAFCTALVASFADPKSRLWQTLLLAGFLVAFSAVIFVKILGLPIPLLRMPAL